MTSHRVAFSLAVGLFASLAAYPAGQGPRFTDWSEPVNLGSLVNSEFNDQAPVVSRDGRSLYFSSNRPGGFGASDLYVSQRSGLDWPWGPPINLTMLNTEVVDWRPSLSRDEHWLFFASSRPGGFGGPDIWASYREHVHDDFSWQPPVNLGPGVNSSMAENVASYFQNDDAGNPQLYISSNRPGGPGSFDIYVSDLLPDGTWDSAKLVAELSTPLPDPGISIRFDGLEAFLFSGMPAAGFDLWVSTRRSVFAPWSAPVALGTAVNGAEGSHTAPSIAPDRQTLYFESNRPGGIGGSDLYVTTRRRARP